MLSTGDPATSDPPPGRRGSLGPFLKPPVRFDILSRRVPSLGQAAEDERAAVEEIIRWLAALNAYVGDFRAGLKLLDHADAHAEFAWSWGPIACRDAGVALVNFHGALKGMREALKLCRSLKAAQKGLRPVEQRFAATFPTARAGRNGVGGGTGRRAGGTGGESRSPLPRRHDDMCDAAIAAHVSRAGRRVTHSLDGRAIRFELSEHTLWRLVAFRNEVFAVFEEGRG